jgi:hypothetical protein
MCEEFATKLRHHESTFPRIDLGIVHLTARDAQRTKREREREMVWKTPK